MKQPDIQPFSLYEWMGHKPGPYPFLPVAHQIAIDIVQNPNDYLTEEWEKMLTGNPHLKEYFYVCGKNISESTISPEFRLAFSNMFCFGAQIGHQMLRRQALHNNKPLPFVTPAHISQLVDKRVLLSRQLQAQQETKLTIPEFYTELANDLMDYADPNFRDVIDVLSEDVGTFGSGDGEFDRLWMYAGAGIVYDSVIIAADNPPPEPSSPFAMNAKAA